MCLKLVHFFSWEIASITGIYKLVHPFTMHPHGVKYDKNNEGALYMFAQTPGDDVLPGGSFQYTVSIFTAQA